MAKSSWKKFSTLGRGGGIIAIVILVGFLDYVTGPEIGFSIFYLLPILAGTWVVGKRFGIGLSFFSAVVWFAAEQFWPTGGLPVTVVMWNGGIRLGMFLIVTALLSKVKALNERLGIQLSETTSELAITEKLSKELEQQASLLRKGVEQVQEGVIITDRNGTIEYVNPAWEKMTGYARKEVYGKTPRILKSGKHPDWLYDSLWKTILDGHTWTSELINKRKDGRFMDIEQTISPIVDQRGSISHFIGVERDISDRKRAKQLLEENEQRLSSIYDTVGDVIFHLEVEKDGGYRFISVNRAFVSTTGITYKQVVGKRVNEIIPEPSLSMVLEKYEKAIREKKIVRWEETSDYPTGRLTGEVSVAPVFDNAGKCTHLVGAVHDITERKRAEEELRVSEERYRRFFEEDLTGDYVSTPEGQILKCNPAFVRIFGFSSRQDALETNATVLYEEPGRWEEFLRLLQEKKRLRYYEVEMCRTDKVPVYVIENVVGEFDKEGNLTEIKGYVFDHTSYRKLQDQLIRAQKLESIGTLASGIAHDLNNVLGPIMIGLEIVQRDVHNPKTLKMLDTMKRSTERGAEILKQILSIARRGEGERILIQPKHLVQEVVRLVNGTFPKNIHVHQELGTDIPTIMGDPTQLHQVLLNLCVNARDAISGQGDLTVGLEAMVIDESFARNHARAQQGPYVVLSVTDTGAGMSQEVKNRIFEPFFTTKIQGQGTGLGLYTVNSLVNNHDGFVTLYSEEGKGTTFRVYLPSKAEMPEAQAIESEEKIVAGNGELVLVVDDEDSVREIMKVMLEAHNYRVVTAVDGAEAIATYANSKDQIALVITDMMMPLMDGSQLIGVLRKINPNIRIIAVSGLTSNGKTGAVPTGDITAFLRKPFSSESILTAIAEALGTKQ